MKLHPAPKFKRIKINSGVSYSGKIRSYKFCINIYHNNDICDHSTQIDFDSGYDKMPIDIHQALKEYFINTENEFLKNRL